MRKIIENFMPEIAVSLSGNFLTSDKYSSPFFSIPHNSLLFQSICLQILAQLVGAICSDPKKPFVSFNLHCNLYIEKILCNAKKGKNKFDMENVFAILNMNFRSSVVPKKPISPYYLLCFLKI